MKKIKSLDVVIVIFSFLLIIVSGIFLFVNSEQGAMVRISTPTEELVYSLDQERIIVVEGTLGESVIVIENGEAYFRHSPCDNQICVLSSAIHDTTGFIACIPNEVFLRIESSDNRESESVFDSIGY